MNELRFQVAFRLVRVDRHEAFYESDDRLKLIVPLEAFADGNVPINLTVIGHG